MKNQKDTLQFFSCQQPHISKKGKSSDPVFYSLNVIPKKHGIKLNHLLITKSEVFVQWEHVWSALPRMINNLKFVSKGRTIFFFFALISNPVVGCEILWLSLNSLHITTICNFNYLNERLAELQYMILAVLLGE